MSDWDTMRNMLDRAGIIYRTGWNREPLSTTPDKDIIKWISILNKRNGKEVGTDFLFLYDDSLLRIIDIPDKV